MTKARALTPALQVRPSAVVRKRRELPCSGTVTVRRGSRVSAADVVLHTEVPGDLRIVRGAEELGIEPSEVKDVVRVSIGQSVQAKEILCRHSALFGLLENFVYAPCRGVVEFIAETTGHIGIREPARRVEVDAYLPGTIVEIDEGRAVVIETQATFIQGIFGVGGERSGSLHCLVDSIDRLVTAEMIPENCRGAVLFGGCGPTGEALELARARGAVGMVVGSVDDRALHEYLGYDIGIAMTGDEPVSMSLIVTEGFGRLPMSPNVLNLLKTHEGKQASINGATQVRAGAVRPEIIVALEKAEGSSRFDENEAVLQLGQKVRLIRVPYFGLFGTIVDLPHKPEVIPTGAETRVAKVQISEGETVTVPRANIELVI